LQFASLLSDHLTAARMRQEHPPRKGQSNLLGTTMIGIRLGNDEVNR
jgi:hypothetical protein